MSFERPGGVNGVLTSRQVSLHVGVPRSAVAGHFNSRKVEDVITSSMHFVHC